MHSFGTQLHLPEQTLRHVDSGSPSPHMLSQCGFREVVSRELIEDSTCKLVIVIPPREHMTMVQLLVEIGEGLLGRQSRNSA